MSLGDDYYLSKLSNLNIPKRFSDVTPDGGFISKKVINLIMKKCSLNLCDFGDFWKVTYHE